MDNTANRVSRRQRELRNLLLLMALICGLPFFFYWGPGYHSSRSFKAVWDLGHVLYFFLFSVQIWGTLQQRQSGLSGIQLFCRLFLIILLLGTAIEFVQHFLGNRSVSISDVLRNQLGCLSAYVFLLSRENGNDLMVRPVRGGKLVTCQKETCATRVRFLVEQVIGSRTVLKWFVFSLLLLVSWPFCRASLDERAARQAFPVLSDFEHLFEQDRWMDPRQLQRTSEVSRHGKYSMRVQLSTSDYSGTTLFYFPSDWRDYTWLRFSVYNPEEENLDLHVRIHDRNHTDHGLAFSDRFHKRFILQQGWNDLEISLVAVRKAPKTRFMDMGNIENLGLFVIRQPRSRVMFLDHIYLCR